MKWLDEARAPHLAGMFFWMVLGAGAYGATVGIWRAPLQAGYVAVKLPLLILLTTLGNAMINWMLAQGYGVSLTLRQSLLAVLLSFCLASVVLGSLAPISLFLVLNCPAMGTPGAATAHLLVIIAAVAFIAFAGVTANLRLFQLIWKLTGSWGKAVPVLFSWLVVNLLLGGQLAWIMRPFIGTPGYQVEFFRDNALDGNFFEAFFRVVANLLETM